MKKEWIHSFTECDVKRFLQWTGDTNSLHHINNVLPGQLLALYVEEKYERDVKSFSITFRNPVFIGEKVIIDYIKKEVRTDNKLCATFQFDV